MSLPLSQSTPPHGLMFILTYSQAWFFPLDHLVFPSPCLLSHVPQLIHLLSNSVTSPHDQIFFFKQLSNKWSTSPLFHTEWWMQKSLSLVPFPKKMFWARRLCPLLTSAWFKPVVHVLSFERRIFFFSIFSISVLWNRLRIRVCFLKVSLGFSANNNGTFFSYKLPEIKTGIDMLEQKTSYILDEYFLFCINNILCIFNKCWFNESLKDE